jgi:hypothetical protein
MQSLITTNSQTYGETFDELIGSLASKIILDCSTISNNQCRTAKRSTTLECSSIWFYRHMVLSNQKHLNYTLIPICALFCQTFAQGTMHPFILSDYLNNTIRSIIQHSI